MGAVRVATREANGRQLLSKVLRPFQEFVESEALGGVLLLASTVVALVWANSPWRDAYVALWKLPISVGPAHSPLTLSLHHWVDDGLMSVFFLLVGLEIKRELLVGELASPRQAALPVAGALGGVLLPALLYALVNLDGVGARGWGIPMATDIAFALAIVR
jgi:Na+:H+ antiporter, NhaA family